MFIYTYFVSKFILTLTFNYFLTFFFLFKKRIVSCYLFQMIIIIIEVFFFVDFFCLSINFKVTITAHIIKVAFAVFFSK